MKAFQDIAFNHGRNHAACCSLGSSGHDHPAAQAAREFMAWARAQDAAGYAEHVKPAFNRGRADWKKYGERGAAA